MKPVVRFDVKKGVVFSEKPGKYLMLRDIPEGNFLAVEVAVTTDLSAAAIYIGDAPPAHHQHIFDTMGAKPVHVTVRAMLTYTIMDEEQANDKD